ncbi:rhoptry protein ROP18 [Besnoitia besnoiti]|uniref:non-specific serine/threonine protein kinase n=1 Tax=Besnoitia besnoiti TaxID=94643 RepID=A0A2A9MD21_BESBE|nr:rhoptry protein ROP18 [Besnoitia besnoiti]PFH33573.1 rhoptry protein ROP18 [Besnoitia besnoiti]
MGYALSSSALPCLAWLVAVLVLILCEAGAVHSIRVKLLHDAGTRGAFVFPAPSAADRGRERSLSAGDGVRESAKNAEVRSILGLQRRIPTGKRVSEEAPFSFCSRLVGRTWGMGGVRRAASEREPLEPTHHIGLGDRIARGLRNAVSWIPGFQRGRSSSATGLRFVEVEPGDLIVARVVSLVADRIKAATSSRIVPDDEIVSRTYWPASVPVVVKSLSTGVTRTLVRGPVIGRGGRGTVCLARDQSTDEEVALKLFIKFEKPTVKRVRELRNEAFFYQRLPGVASAADAQALFRLMVPTDAVQVVNAPPSLRYAPAEIWVPNMFPIMPKAQMDVARFVNVLTEFDDVSQNELGVLARLQLTLSVIRLVAILHTQGVVHADIKPENFFVMGDGRVFLRDFGASGSDMTTAPFGGTLAYTPPELSAPTRYVQYKYSTDSWGVGLVLCFIWCDRVPVTSRVHEFLVFDSCPRDVPDDVKTLVRMFLETSPRRRLSPLRAIRRAEFNRVKERVDRGGVKTKNMSQTRSSQAPTRTRRRTLLRRRETPRAEGGLSP